MKATQTNQTSSKTFMAAVTAVCYRSRTNMTPIMCFTDLQPLEASIGQKKLTEDFAKAIRSWQFNFNMNIGRSWMIYRGRDAKRPVF